MNGFEQAFGHGLTAWALLALGFSAVTLWRLRRAPGGTAPAPAEWPEVLLLRPMDAPTPRELANLAAEVDYPGRLEQVVVSPYRPRLPSTVAWLPSDPMRRNRKAGHLAYALSALEVKGRVVLSVDADVAVDGALVKGLVAPLLHGAALSTAAPAVEGAAGLAGRAVRSLLCHGHHSFLALHVMSAGAQAVCGKALGLSAEAQRLLPDLADHIGEDLELSKALHARGQSVALSPACARVPSAPTRASAALDRFTRWMQVLRAHRPGLFPTVPLLFAPAWPLGFCALVHGGAVPAAAVLSFLAARVLLGLRLGALHGVRAGAATDWVMAEALLLSCWVLSLFRKTVTWRGRAYAVLPGGRMVPDLSGEGLSEEARP
ncbi:MAG: carotenoid biosynthesis protein [Deltaproteobacteria bacterium]|nr:carotenoid biosynthesis protein [Deltaproteobacteria bacterium]